MSRFIPAPAGNSITPAAIASSVPVHPRACGEQSKTDQNLVQQQSVHPRACGEQRRLHLHYLAVGSSPRLRGRKPSMQLRSPRPVHPRACGEQIDAMTAGQSGTGSSPRLRGTVSTARISLSRFIPAPAGNRNCKALRWLRSFGSSPRLRGTGSKHSDLMFDATGSSPRLRGTGLIPVDVHAMPPLGSSPRLRGTDAQSNRQRRRRRFIPAPAGNSMTPGTRRGLSVHPRACGEQQRQPYCQCQNTGSSPRLRGTESCCGCCPAGSRFIPAPAGNRSSQVASTPKSSVHPRACGEQLLSKELRQLPPGSSPRLRGTGKTSATEPATSRFIPAPAGNSWSAEPFAARHTVHPRACGEQWSCPSPPDTSCGSSPRLRGTDHHRQHQRPDYRFIPAPAGNSRRPARPSSDRSVHPRACGEQISYS